MRRFIATLLLSASLVVGCGSKDTPEAAAEETIGAMKEYTSILKTVKDEASAKAAEPKLKQLATKLEELNKHGEKYEKMSDAEKKALQDKYEPQMQALAVELMQEAFRIGMDPKLAPLLENAKVNLGNSNNAD